MLTRRRTCTSLTARWCPNCGTCAAEYTGDDFRACPCDCPLHGHDSRHPLAPCEDCEPTHGPCPHHGEAAGRRQPSLFGGQP